MSIKTESEHDSIRKRLLKRAGIGESTYKERKLSLDDLERLQWSAEFERLMKNRLVMATFRYGLHNAPGKKAYDRVASIIRRAKAYEATGNAEHLVDLANEALCEFVEEIYPHPNRHFAAQDDSTHTAEK